MYDRVGVLQEGGKVDMYPPPDFQTRRGVAGARPQVDGSAEKTSNFAANGAGPGLTAGAADNKSLKSVKSVYYDAQDELD